MSLLPGRGQELSAGQSTEVKGCRGRRFMAALCLPDVGADLLAMCQRNIALNSHLLEAKVTIDKLSEDNVSVWPI